VDSKERLLVLIATLTEALFGLEAAAGDCISCGIAVINIPLLKTTWIRDTTLALRLFKGSPSSFKLPAPVKRDEN
jgi:hypothetical protein